MSVKYRVILGFDVIATDVADAEKEVAEMIKAADSLEDLKEELVGFRVMEMADGVKETQSQ